MKIYDFDGMFDEKLSDYISKNAEKFKEAQWEDIIPKLYDKFGDTKIKSLGVSPRDFYKAMSESELVASLKLHIKKEVAVPEFLCEAIEERGADELLIPLLDGTQTEVEYAISLLGANEKVTEKYLDILLSTDDEDLKNRCVDNIREHSDLISNRAFELYKEGKDREYMLEILSRVSKKDDKIFELLLNAFRSDEENIPMHASYLSAYGDERALEFLYDKIESDGIGYVEFRELKIAIESLGGTYDKERDFSSDPYYQMLKCDEVSDIFNNFSK